MKNFLEARLAIIVCLCLCLSILAANSANAQVTVSDPVIDDQTGGDWRGTYGECFFLIPDPQQIRVEVPVGPDFFSDSPEQYENSNCFGGLLFDDGTIDFRICRGDMITPANAFGWTTNTSRELPLHERQWIPCILNPDGTEGGFKGTTWDDGDPANPVIQPLVVKLNIGISGSIKLAYYFINGELHNGGTTPECRTQDFRVMGRWWG